ncbi:ubiquitin-conjugating enzyme [Diaporthe helianthi]|uniref:Ubiquitin-conjugating enzyme n=1 Tax=Diaporthe helianthi TaxID=158607 RepID=A0A2P5IFG4_DIAHE|nr:ubiquitin-conjugating enzyme [Diaporthe helianthi]
MASLKMAMLPSLRRQNLLAEFAGLKQSCPQGVFVSLTPGDPSLWSGVMFVRKGPYATAILRFYISFPDSYPALPPLVTFSTDMFHPLITPLTTYMYTTDIQEGGTVSATDEERLPPGGFSLRHGFPDWFGRGSRGRPAPGQYPPETPKSSRALAGGGESNSSTPNSKIAATPPSAGRGAAGNTGTGGSTGSKQSFADVHKREISTGEVLRYMRSTFDDQAVLDSIPLEAAGNPGAWHAWASYRGHTAIPEGEPAARDPGEWNWEGVWEERVQRNIQASLSEPVLYGDTSSDETIRFLSMEESEVETVKDNLYKTLGESARADPLAVPSVSP